MDMTLLHCVKEQIRKQVLINIIFPGEKLKITTVSDANAI